MGQIDRTGTFRGIDVNRVIDESSGGHVQWVADLVATEYYDEETQQWVDWSEYDVNEIRCWIMLFNKDASKEAFFGTKNLQKAGRWSGISLQELRQEPSDGLIFQFRVEEDTYQGETRLKVTSINHYDAEPGRALEGLDDAAVKSLDAKYAAVLRNLSGGPKPKSIPAKPPVPKPATPAPVAPGQPVQTVATNPELVAALKSTPAIDKESAKAAMKEQMEERAARGEVAETKAKRGRPPKPKPQAPKTTAIVKTCTLEQAWEAVHAAKPEGTPDDKINDTWLNTIDKYGDQDTLTGAEWVTVRDEVIAEITS